MRESEGNNEEKKRVVKDSEREMCPKRKEKRENVVLLWAASELDDLFRSGHGGTL